MRYMKLTTVLVLLTILSSIFGVAAYAQGVGSVGNADAGVQVQLGDPTQWTSEDLLNLVDLAVAERIAVSELQVVWQQLSLEQQQQVGFALAEAVGISTNEWARITESEGQIASGTVKPPVDVKPEFVGEIWRQFIENQWTNGQPPGSTFARMYFDSPLCDNDPNDHDWSFLFDRSYEWYSRNPDGLRWTTNSSQVYLAFMTAYGGNLNSYSFSWREARLCLGTGGVSAAGGTANVQSSVFLHPNN